MTEQDIITMIKPILLDAGVQKAALFGSVARGETNEDSDVDILVEFGDRGSLFGFLRLKTKLQDILHKEVDLVTYKALRPELKTKILQDQQVIYGERF